MRRSKGYSVNFDLSKMARALPKETAHLLNDIGVLIIQDIRSGVEKRQNIDGSAAKPLKKKTIDRKRKLGYKYPDIPRVATNQMVGIGKKDFSKGPYFQRRASASSIKAIIIPPSIKAPYSVYQQENRPWFGVSRRVDKPILKAIDRAAERIMEAASV